MLEKTPSQEPLRKDIEQLTDKVVAERERLQTERERKEEIHAIGVRAVQDALAPEIREGMLTPEQKAERDRAGAAGLKAVEAALAPTAPASAPAVASEAEKPHVDDPHDVWDIDAFEKFSEKEKAPKQDVEGWREHFGVLAQIEEEKEAMQKEKEATPAATPQEAAPAAPAPAAAPKTVEVVIPTQEELERSLAQLRAGAKLQEARVEAQAEKSGVLNTVKAVGGWYNKRPLWQKLIFGGTMLAFGVPGASMGQKVLSGAGMFATLDALTKEKFKDKPYMRGILVGGASVAYAIFASELFKAVGVTQSLEEMLRGWFAGPETYTPTHTPEILAPLNLDPTHTPEILAPLNLDPTHTPEVLAPLTESAPASLEALNDTATAGRGDSVWRLTEKQLLSNPDFSGLDRAQKDFVLDSYMKHLQSLGSEGLREFGLASGKLDVLRIGETLNFEKISDKSLFESFLEKAENLTAAEKANILKARG